MQLNLKKLTGLCYATDELMDDANALAAVVADGFQEEFGFKVDDSIMNGTGAGEPAGILNSDALVSVSKESGQPAATIEVNNLIKMWSRCWGRSRQNAVWFINQDIEPMLHTLGMEFGLGGGQLVYMPAGGLSSSPYGTLYGRPVIPVEQCATLGTVGDIVLADLSQYLWVDKGPIATSNSMHVRFLYDEMTYKFTYRADGQSVWNSALTPKNGTATLSPFVALATRS
jgi:HK97 family phage major capsid protein